MENASKALLIAGAILIAIVLISLGVMILGQGSDLVKNANMSDAEITTYNSEFEQFLGSKIRGNMVRQLINKVDQHNRTYADDYSKQIELVADGEKAATETTVDHDGAVTNQAKASDVQTGFTYKVEASYNSVGLISKIYFQKTS